MTLLLTDFAVKISVVAVVVLGTGMMILYVLSYRRRRMRGDVVEEITVERRKLVEGGVSVISLRTTSRKALTEGKISSATSVKNIKERKNIKASSRKQEIAH